MSFDDEVDAARDRLKASLSSADDSLFDELAALQALVPKLESKIRSKRLTFAVSEEDDAELSIAVLHASTDEELGHIFAEDGEYVFESSLEDYFDDFVDEDADAFVSRLYETLKTDLAKYEIENEI